MTIHEEEKKTQGQEQQVECEICYEDRSLDDFRVMKPCAHKMCVSCMKEMVKRQEVKCPMCRQEFDLERHTSDLWVPPVLPSMSEIYGDLFGGRRSTTMIELLHHLSPSQNPMIVQMVQGRTPGSVQPRTIQEIVRGGSAESVQPPTIQAIVRGDPSSVSIAFTIEEIARGI